MEKSSVAYFLHGALILSLSIKIFFGFQLASHLDELYIDTITITIRAKFYSIVLIAYV